ncbi:MAG: glycosyltransferase family 2 protein [Phenylobacterium sp.]
MSSLYRAAHRLLAGVRAVPWVHRPVHGAARWLTRLPAGKRLIRGVLAFDTGDYPQWIAAHDGLTAEDRQAIAAHIARMPDRPLISVVMPVYNAPEALLREAIESVRTQLYDRWELCIADDASPDAAVWRVLSEYAGQDPRIRIVRRGTNGNISAATNSALALASGSFVALMDHDDRLSERALYEVAAELAAHPDADLIYSDEDRLDERGARIEPYFKPDWSPDLMLGQNLVNHLAVYRRALVEAVGGLREGLEGAQDWDLALRIAEHTRPDRIRHIPAVLYHWRQPSSPETFSGRQAERCAAAARRAVEEHLQRTGQSDAVVENQPGAPAWLAVRRRPPATRPLVSVIVPTRDRARLLAECAAGVLERTAYAPLELIVVDNGSVEPATFALFDALKRDPRVRVLPAPGPFNYSRLNNQAVAAARGELLLLLNNDVAVRQGDWLDEMVGHAVRPDVGAVGARLVYPDGSLQHAGVVLGVGGNPPVAGHLCHGAPPHHPGYAGLLNMTREASAVTAACLAVRRDVYEQVGGFDEAELAVAFNDVDLCLKIRAAGYRIVWTPHAELLHLESASRGDDTGTARFAREIAAMRRRWGETLDHDPYYNPNLDRGSANFRIGAPLRRKPWA